jgi:predicted dehydrogenase
VRAGKKYGIKIAVGPSARFLPVFCAAKKALDSGKIGRPFSLQVTHHHGVIDVFHKNDFYRNAKEGGPELSLGWYVIDLVLYFLGQPVKSLSAAYGNYTSPASPFMDCGRIVMRMQDDALASCNMYFCNRVPYPAWEMEILGTKGAIMVRHPVGGNPTVTLHIAKGVENVPLPGKTPNWEVFWVDYFMKNKKLELNAEYGRELTRLSLAARDAARKQRLVT